MSVAAALGGGIGGVLAASGTAAGAASSGSVAGATRPSKTVRQAPQRTWPSATSKSSGATRNRVPHFGQARISGAAASIGSGTGNRGSVQAMRNSGVPVSIARPFSTSTSATVPARSLSTLFIIFMLSTMHSVSPTDTSCPTSTNGVSPGAGER